MMRKFLIAFNLLAPLAGLALLLSGHGWWGLSLVFAGHMLWLWATLSPSCYWFGPVRITSGNDTVMLTFDDGPHPEHTPWVLDQLAEAKMKAVFFLIGNRAAAHPELVRRIMAEGHVIGNHTQTHPQSKFWRLGTASLRSEIAAAQQTLGEICGQVPRLFRSPVGHHSFWLWPVLRQHQLELVGWSARGFDGVSTEPTQILARLLPNIRPGAIILLHDDRPSIRETLPAVLEAIRQEGEALRKS
jgi:peptidoglycan/xylan/chitin deacetylase (PgdA/CDA1 family)